MFTLQRAEEAARVLETLPRLVIAGVLVMVAGLGLDLLVHLAPAHEHVHAGFDPQEHVAHLVGVVGMALTWAGVVIDGVRRQARRTSPAQERSGSYADR